jgi:hypothetical protein
MCPCFMGNLQFYCVHMSVCINSCQSRAHEMDISKCNNTVFVNAVVHFIVSLAVAAVKGRERGLHVQHNCRAWGHEGTGWKDRKTGLESRQGQETFYSLHLSGPIEQVPNAVSPRRIAVGGLKLTPHLYLVSKLSKLGSTHPSFMSWTRTVCK